MRGQRAAWNAVARFFEDNARLYDEERRVVALGLCSAIAEESGASKRTRAAMLRKVRGRAVRQLARGEMFYTYEGSRITPVIEHPLSFYQWPLNGDGYRARAAWARGAAKRC